MPLVAAALAAIAFQAFHFAEHVAQLGYWMANPSAAPWLSAWAGVARDQFARVAGGGPAAGAELLHLVGNGIFLAGLAAAAAALRSAGADRRGSRWTRRALWVEGFHLAEHVALTLSVVAVGRPLGLSTAFGLLSPGTPIAGSYRVWWHLLINLVATVLALRAIAELRAKGLIGRRAPAIS